MKLSPAERLILINQYTFLGRLEGDESIYKEQIEALRGGFEIEYTSPSWILEDVLSTDECSEVINVLAMFDHFKTSLDHLGDKEGLTDQAIRFRGFHRDGEGRQWSYARHLIQDQRRFLTKVDDLIAYQHMLPTYRKFYISRVSHARETMAMRRSKGYSQKPRNMAPKVKRKLGRPTKATPQLIQAVLDDLARGLNREWACAVNNCSHDQWQEWEKRPEFAGLRARAIGTRVKYLVSRLETEENPAISKSLQWLLERTKSYENQFAAPALTIFEQNNFQLLSDEKTREIDARVQRLKLEDWDRPA